MRTENQKLQKVTIIKGSYPHISLKKSAAEFTELNHLKCIKRLDNIMVSLQSILSSRNPQVSLGDLKKDNCKLKLECEAYTKFSKYHQGDNIPIGLRLGWIL